MEIVFTKHAQEKFGILRRHGFRISERKVRKTMEMPEYIDRSRAPLLIAQAEFDSTRVVRVVYKEEFGVKKIITFYPGRKQQYGKRQK
ncbi:MAG: hypothetical protein A2946_00950 [Candidatus Liptonbacteria bacterium RIFCSPLOWO2_01_FULL_53_13]|uniref:DUF4258 domain-containing protein n=1 Tax=Candidatus Liptonbacteria bacterium RIFCSPLOWO2_01_FULL_53_13 TaxID=1798651 RepID=A0A1G2CJ84_9BACT|nr:MAG: hypothetical protein A2946_00950 [Candidatus Liptonbacteria bacterium RIFCSPLOWO2_01_FULL_53_13]